MKALVGVVAGNLKEGCPPEEPVRIRTKDDQRKITPPEAGVVSVADSKVVADLQLRVAALTREYLHGSVYAPPTTMDELLLQSP